MFLLRLAYFLKSRPHGVHDLLLDSRAGTSSTSALVSVGAVLGVLHLLHQLQEHPALFFAFPVASAAEGQLADVKGCADIKPGMGVWSCSLYC
eukprot:3457770-Rhodomonas_salina.2